MTSDSTPAFEIEKEALKTEIETGIQAGVDHLEAKTAKRKDADKYHNTRHLLKQYRKVAYAIQISEADMNVRMEMEHGTRLSTLEVNAELAGVDLSGSKLEGYARTVIRSKNMLQIIDNALNTVRMDPDHGELMYQVLYLTYFSKKKPANREVILGGHVQPNTQNWHFHHVRPLFLFGRRRIKYALDYQQWKKLCGDYRQQSDDHHCLYRSRAYIQQ